jgi:hypothetical protein
MRQGGKPHRIVISGVSVIIGPVWLMVASPGRGLQAASLLRSVKRSITFEGREMLDHTDKAERYWALMLRYHDLAEQAELPFLRDSYRKVAAR